MLVFEIVVSSLCGKDGAEGLPLRESGNHPPGNTVREDHVASEESNVNRNKRSVGMNG